MKTLIHRILYRTLPFEGYLRAVSRMFFVWQRLGIGRYAPATEYVYHLGRLVRRGDTCIDIGANLGYYARTISRLTGPEGRVYAVEPVEPIRRVLERNLRRCRNVEILPSRSAPNPERWPWATTRHARRATSARGRTS